MKGERIAKVLHGGWIKTERVAIMKEGTEDQVIGHDKEPTEVWLLFHRLEIGDAERDASLQKKDSTISSKVRLLDNDNVMRRTLNTQQYQLICTIAKNFAKYDASQHAFIRS